MRSYPASSNIRLSRSACLFYFACHVRFPDPQVFSSKSPVQRRLLAPSPSPAQRASRPPRLSPRPIRKDGCHRRTMEPTGDLKPRRLETYPGKAIQYQIIQSQEEEYPITEIDRGKPRHSHWILTPRSPDWILPAGRVSKHNSTPYLRFLCPPNPPKQCLPPTRVPGAN